MEEKTRKEMISENLIRAFLQFKRLRFEGGPYEHGPIPPGHGPGCPGHDPANPDHGLKKSEILLLFELYELEERCPSGVSVSDISSALRVKPPSITRIISSLEEKNMLERATDSNDRRIVRVKLKDEGRKLVHSARQRTVSYIKGLVDYLGEEKSVALAEMINETFAYITLTHNSFRNKK